MKLHISHLLGTFVTYDGSVEEAPGIRTFRFRPSRGVKWESGQYYVYVLPGALRDKRTPVRPFTVSSAPTEKNLQFTTRIVATPSIFKQQLLKLKPGAKVYAAGPYGFFLLKPGPSVFLAGGIGVTPFRAMLLELSAAGAMPDITMLYANRDADIPFKAEFDTIASTNPNLKIIYLPPTERLDAASVQKYIPNPQNSTYYVSGPKPMVTGVAAELSSKLGISKSKIKHDSFKGYPWPDK